MLIVFEGIDGSGKTTVSNLVAEHLRDLGLRVVHVRQGGRLASPTAESIRQLARDPRNLALTPLAEFLLYVAREAQQLEECIQPALAACDVVIADRFLPTAEVLAGAGRGLPASRIAPVIAAVAGDVEVDLHVLIDVDPRIARARRRADKIVRPDQRTSSRKGLSGAGLMRRLRDGYLRRAGREPSRWLLIDNTSADLLAVVDRVTAAIVALRAGSAPRLEPAARRSAAPATDPESARRAFLDWLDDTGRREPEVAAQLLAGMHGPGIDRMRAALAERAPAVIARGLRGLSDPATRALRERLAAAHPDVVARSLDGLPGDDESAWALRERLAAAAPSAVATSLEGLACTRAWALRHRLFPVVPAAVVTSLGGDGSAAAWSLREHWLDAAGGEPAIADVDVARALCRSLRGLADERAWFLRELAWASAPASALQSLAGVDDDRAWAWRRRHLARAPVPVLRSIAGLDSEPAWALRERAAPLCKEVLDGIVGLDAAPAWQLRDQLADAWPSATVKSLGGLGITPRGRALVCELLARHGGDIALLRQAAVNA